MTPEQQLAALLVEHKHRKYPNIPNKAIPKVKVKVTDSNSLTKAILQTFEGHDLYATRVQSQGQYDARLRRFRRGTTRRGTADVHGVINGRHCSIEVKYGKDRMSDAQRKTADQVTAAGGIYYIARDFASFWTWFHAQNTQGL